MNVPEKKLGKLINKCSLFLFKKKFEYNGSFLLAKKYGKVAAKRLAGRSFDVIVTVAGSPEIAFLKTDIPMVLIEDATFAILQNYYPQYTDLLKLSIHQTNTTEALAIQKANLAIYSSEWAARSAVEMYHADAHKVHVVPYGANFENPPSKETVQARKKSGQCRLLFLAVSWERKGGAIAFETLLKLEEMGISAELIVCGCVPPKEFTHQRMKVIPFLDKNDEKQREELNKLFLRSDFLLLPTRGDCTPIVFCEASAFGLPVITTNTGGVSGVITDGENGFMLPFEARGLEYAKVIAEMYQNEQRYAELVKSSRAAFDDKLNWDAWGTTMKRLIDEMLEQRHSSAHSQSTLSKT
ncbi:MAG: glycosyltransferase family 4 protein [Chloroflexota bacterium]|nr:glycosyltransferase family 4 protein [Chloroflexota bacterium]